MSLLWKEIRGNPLLWLLVCAAASQGPVRIDFACALDRRATVLELTMTRQQPR